MSGLSFRGKVLSENLMKSSDISSNKLSDLRIKRRRDIDGLRGVAVIAVVGYHFFPEWFPGGYVGVDIFFVISGFVITNLLIRQQPYSIQSLMIFWGRRVRRLFPALALVIGATLIAGWFILWPVQFQGLANSAVWSAAMLGNIYAYFESGYFAAEPTWNPLLNLWSLGVEEQFYLAWPILLGVLWVLVGGRNTRLVATIALLGILSWIAALVFGRSEVGGTALGAVFYLPWFRAWELLAGAFIALLAFNRKPGRRSESRLSSGTFIILYWLVATLLIVSLFWDYGSQRPAQYALLAVVATSVVIALGPYARNSTRLFSNSALVGVGAISYPWYLWHWPILALGLAAGIGQTTNSKLSLITLSIVLAVGTKVLVENPIQGRDVKPKLVAGLVGVLAFIVAVGLFFSNMSLSKLNDQDLASQLTNFTYVTDPDYDVGGCFIEGGDGQEPEDLADCIPSDINPRETLVWGDSHAASMMLGIRKYLPEGTVSQLTIAGCFPSLPEDAVPESCNASNNLALDAISDGKFSNIVLAAWWREEYEAEDLVKLIQRIHQISDSKVTVVGPLPWWSPALNRIWTPDEIEQMERLPLYTQTGLLDYPRKFDDDFRRVLRGLDVNYVSPLDVLCNIDGCRVSLDGTPQTLTAWDYGHLTNFGSQLLGPDIIAGFN